MNDSNSDLEGRSDEYRICCLIDDGTRCHRQASNASYSKRIQRTVSQRHLKLTRESHVSHIYICDHHKNMILSVRNKGRRKKESDEDGDTPEVDFHQLQVGALRRYKRHFKIQTRPGMNKAQLVENLQKHFYTIPVVEKEALSYFIYMVKTFRSKLDQKPLDASL